MKHLFFLFLVTIETRGLQARPFVAISQPNAELLSALVRDEAKRPEIDRALARMAVTDSKDAAHASIKSLAEIDEAAPKVAAVYVVCHPPEDVAYVTSHVSLAPSDLAVGFIWLLAHGQTFFDTLDWREWDGDLKGFERLCAEINATLHTQGTFLEYARASRGKDAGMFVCSPTELRNWSIKQLRSSLIGHEWPADEKALLIHLHNTLMQTSFVPVDGGEALPKERAVALAARFHAVPPQPQNLIKDAIDVQVREALANIGAARSWTAGIITFGSLLIIVLIWANRRKAKMRNG